MRHTYLLTPGTWRADGSYTNEDGEQIAVTGESIIDHGDTEWTVTGFMRLSTDVEVEIRHDYRVEPFEGNDSTPWRSNNHALGTLEGHFAIIGDNIISAYGSVDGRHHGVECLRRLGEDSYEGVGVLFQGERRVSSWSVRLSRQ